MKIALEGKNFGFWADNALGKEGAEDGIPCSAVQWMKLAISRESLGLIVICVADAVLTAAMVIMGLAEEANPLMAFFLDRSITVFFLIKLGTVVPLVMLAERHRRRNPVFIKKCMRFAIVSYLGIYFTGVIAVNFV